MREPGADDRIVVHGTAERAVVPDGGSWSIVVEEEDQDPAAAFERCSARASALVAELELLLRDGGRLTTGSVAVRTQRENYDGPISGHLATAAMTVQAPLDLAGTLAAAAMRSGASRLVGPQPRYDGLTAARAELLAEAVEAARDKAKLMADAAGRTLGRVVSVTEAVDDDGYVVAMSASSTDDDGPPIRPGPQTVGVRVVVVVELAS